MNNELLSFYIILQAQVKSYMTMLLEGVAYLHDNNIMHRVRVYESNESLPIAYDFSINKNYSNVSKYNYNYMSILWT